MSIEWNFYSGSPNRIFLGLITVYLVAVHNSSIWSFFEVEDLLVIQLYIKFHSMNNEI